jgi:hypothetical protein
MYNLNHIQDQSSVKANHLASASAYFEMSFVIVQTGRGSSAGNCDCRRGCIEHSRAC